MRAFLSLVTLAACSSNSQPETVPNPLGQFPEGMVNELVHGDYCEGGGRILRGDKVYAHDAGITPVDPADLPASIRPAVPVYVACHWNKDGATGHIELEYDEGTRSVLLFQMRIVQSVGRGMTPDAKRLLTRYVEPWLRTMSPTQLHDYLAHPIMTIDEDSKNELRGPHWRGRGGIDRWNSSSDNLEDVNFYVRVR